MKKNIAVIGCGDWGKNLIRNFCELNVLGAICDTDNHKLRLLQEKYPSPWATHDHREILKDGSIEGVAVATPAATHYPLAKDALLAGKDVFVEKPLGLNSREGEELVALAEKKERILMVGHILEYHPAVVKLKEMVRKGELGNLKYIYSNRLNLGKFRTEENVLSSFAPLDISIILSLLEESPVRVSTHGANCLDPNITAVTMTNLEFPSGVKAHIFISWLHPYKEKKLVVIGGKKMAVFDSATGDEKIYVYDHKIDWIDRIPVPRPEDARAIDVEGKEPMRSECEHFLECINLRTPPRTDGLSGLRVLRVLDACHKSLRENGRIFPVLERKARDFFLHESSFMDENVRVGEGTKIWHFSHLLKNTRVGKNCSIGQNVVIGPNVTIGDNVKIQNNVSVYDGVTLEDDVFCGPSMVFTNVVNPRSHWPRKDEYRKTEIRRGASLGANSTIVCGITVGRYAFVGAGALVNRDVPDYALVHGVPARLHGWMCYCGVKLDLTEDSLSDEETECHNCRRRYKKAKCRVEEIPKP
jgi:UDP-2-acetamido-3-amino-2,3-dideoxy-glucuronate N-acetyltransferase